MLLWRNAYTATPKQLIQISLMSSLKKCGALFVIAQASVMMAFAFHSMKNICRNHWESSVLQAWMSSQGFLTKVTRKKSPFYWNDTFSIIVIVIIIENRSLQKIKHFSLWHELFCWGCSGLLFVFVLLSELFVVCSWLMQLAANQY